MVVTACARPHKSQDRPDPNTEKRMSSIHLAEELLVIAVGEGKSALFNIVDPGRFNMFLWIWPYT